MKIEETINKVVNSIKKFEEKRKNSNSKLMFLRNKNLLKFNSDKFEEFLEEKLVVPISKISLNERIAGIDSGFVPKSFASFDLLFIRAVSAIFDYKNSKLFRASYFPESFSFPNPIALTDLLERDEFNNSISLYRLLEEIQTGIDVIEKFSPQNLILDGSIIPQYTDKPREDSKTKELYDLLIEKFQELYKKSEENECDLIACIEDSRGTRFRGILQNIILQGDSELQKIKEELENFSDTSLFDNLLKLNERSCVFSYTKNIKQHPILNDFKKSNAEKVHAFYLKPSQYDRPIRIEFLSKKENVSIKANKIAERMLTLSSYHREYAYPTVLIEADLRARLRPEEINIVFDKISSKIGSNILVPQRRNKRPF